MADDDSLKPMDDGDTAPPASTEFTPAEPLKGASVDFKPAETGDTSSSGSDAKPGAGKGDGAADRAGATRNVRDNLTDFGTQAADRFHEVFDDGKERIGGLLDQLAQTLTDAADQVDDKLGGQYGGYARNAAGSVQDLAQTVRDKDVEDLTDDVRFYVRQSPAVALGIAAVLGFALTRVAQAGFDKRA